MANKRPITYLSSGVDLKGADRVKNQIKEIAKKAQTKDVLSGIGSFGGLFSLNLAGFKEPILVGSADGIGTKVILARKMHKFKNLGMDIVNHCVNDIGAMGAKPLFFLDYLAFGKLSSDMVTEIVSSIAEACQNNNCSLLGGETAEMPDLYKQGDFDIAGFIVGMVERSNIIDGKKIKAGDVLFGIESNGLHTNGYSLIRKIFFEKDYSRLSEKLNWDNVTLGDALLKPHLSYHNLLQNLSQFPIKGIAHITGGGIAGNLSRILPKGTSAKISSENLPVSPLFSFIQEEGKISNEEMRSVFNLGIGLIIIISPEQIKELTQIISSTNYNGLIIGKIIEGNGEVTFG